MRIQVLLLVLGAGVFGAKLPSRHDGTSEVLSRTVSVKTPERVSSVISHFSPADHRYDAVGSVQINKESESTAKALLNEGPQLKRVSTTVREPSVQNAQRTLSRTVSVKTPERKSNVISHFTPVDHRYDATGSVLINQGSANERKGSRPAPVVQRPISAPAPAPSIPAPAPVPVVQVRTQASSTGKSLSRTVSVKTPERRSNVISHFTPADHIYDATGSVVISHGSTSERKASEPAPAIRRPAPVPAPARSIPAPAPVVPKVAPAPRVQVQTSASGKSLSRTVSVKTPERRSNVISHFTPADHRYDATGSVIITQGSSSERKASVPAPVVRSPAPAPAPARSIPAPVPAAPKPIPAPRVQAQASSSGKSLSRTVSVKTPQRTSSVISHFTPADHRYDATGSVIITQGSSSEKRASVPTQTVRRPAPAPLPARSIPAPAPAAPSPAAPKPISAPRVQFQAASTGKSLSRTVSVKTPERRSNVISHFTPADHRYDATGSVVITQGSSSERKASVPAPVVRRPAPAPAPAPVRSIPAPAPVRSIPAPAPAAPKPASSPRVQFQASSAGKSLSRTVSVKTPERTSSVISHFTPADHRYDATGSVVITQGSSSERKISTPAQAVRKPAPVPVPSPARSFPAPSPAAPKPAPASRVQVQASSTGKSLSRTVSVKTPERKSNVISHFSPADHRYDATGSVVITQGSSSERKVSVPAPVIRRPAPAPVPAIRRPNPAPAPVAPKPAPAPRVQVQASATGKSLSRTVSVKTPERRSNVISHFTPADHRYDATGSVIITQGSSSERKTSVPAPVVRRPAPAPVVRRPAPAPAPARSIPAPAPAAPKPAPTPRVQVQASSAGKSLSRTVSVKTPERKSNVISHFSPADHRYDATGSVIITQGSTSERKASVPAPVVRRPAPAPAPARSIPAPAPAAPKPAPTPRVQVQASSAGKSLSRTVSVKTPEHKSNVISHFSPADHRYDATGSVIITQGSSSERKVSIPAPVVRRPAPAPAPAPARSIPAPAPAAPKPAPAPRVQVQASSAGKSLSRTVSVKTPERKSNVISHFSPADHRYDATGSVIITQGSSSERKASVPAPVVRRPIPAPAPARSIPAPAPAVRKPAPAPRVQVQSSSSGKSLSRTVSVKTPERLSSVISHFTPADHRYDATGKVIINQGAKSFSQSPAASASAKSSSASSVSSSSINLGSASVSQASGSGAAKSGLTRKISIKTPERDSGVHSHFSPDDHSFEASGSVTIAGSSTGKVLKASSSSQQTSSSASSSVARGSSQSTGSSSSGRISSSQSSGRQHFLSSQGSGESSESQSSSSSSSSRRSHSSGSVRLAAPVTKASSSSLSAALQAELKSFREEAAASGAAAPEVRQNINDDGEREEYYFNLCVEDHENTNYQCRDEWVGSDGITRGWYTVLLPDAFFYNYTYIAHPVKGYQVSVTRRDSGIAMKQVEADIFAPATVFSNQGITKFSDFAVSGVNNRFVESQAMNFDQNSAALFARTQAEAMGTVRSSSSGSAAAVSSGPASHINGFRLELDSGSSGSSSGRIVSQSSSSSGSGKSIFSSGASSQRISSSQSSSSASSKSSQRAQTINSNAGQGSSQASLSRTVSVKTPERISSTISHFTPSDHRFDATGRVIINQGSSQGSAAKSSSRATSSSQSSSSRNSASAVQSSGSSQSSASQLSLSRTVSVKTPERVSGVISHFTPADHRYDATGSVLINQGSSSSAAASNVRLSAPVRTVEVKAPEIVVRPIKSTPLRTATAAKSSQKSLSRTVSVKTPERQSSVINHFTPADHRYEATGSVSITSGSSGSSNVRVSAPVRPVVVKAPEVVVRPIKSTPLRTATVAKSSQKSLSRTVSVKTPERQSSVINHFTPADHRYEATGSVSITSGSSGSSGSSRTTKQFIAPQPAPAPRSPSREPKPIAPPRSTAKSISSSSRTQAALSRTVSVKSPERVSSVISHFTPADHRYEATGSVVINRESSTGTSGPQLIQRPAPATTAPLIVRAPVVVQAPRVESKSQASLSRTVSVKTPERVSGVISHFNPADHRYEATGSVLINSGSVSSPRRPTVKVSSPIVNVPAPAPARAKSIASVPARPAASPAAGREPSQLSLSRTISVKSPERVSSVISHFTPAVHQYEATGSVTINRASA